MKIGNLAPFSTESAISQNKNSYVVVATLWQIKINLLPDFVYTYMILKLTNREKSLYFRKEFLKQLMETRWMIVV